MTADTITLMGQTIIAYLGFMLLAVLLLAGRREWRAFRRRREYDARCAERSERVYEDECWTVHRREEAALAITLWRIGWSSPMAEAARNVTDAFNSFGVKMEEASWRLDALLASDPERRV